MQLYSPADLDDLQKEISCLIETKEWLKNFLAKPHPDLGRPGPVCPFLPRSLQLNTIRLAVIRTQNSDQQQIENIVRQQRDVFLEMEPKDGELALYKAFMLIFPDISTEEAPQLIDAVQHKLKPFFVETGLMLGEFHQLNETPGLHNPDFRPLRSPIPMLAIRFMAESDLPFLQRVTDEPELRIRYLEAYLQRLGTIIKDPRKLEEARKSLLKAQLESLETVPEQPVRKCPFARLAAVFK